MPVVEEVPVHSRRYGPDVLAAGKPRRRELRRVPAERGLVVEPAFLGRVEQLIDFATAPGSH